MQANRLLIALALLVLSAASLQVHAAGSKDFGEIQVHYSVLPSTFLSPEIARANDLNRSRGIGIVNISLMREMPEGNLKPVSGQVEGRVVNDVQQPKFLAFRRIQEGEAVYFIAEFPYSSGELLTFEITARPTGAGTDMPVRFAHTLYSD